MERYRICVRGHLDRGWTAHFPDLELTHRPDGTTLLRGPVVDQVALHGLLQRLGSLGLPILEVRRLDHPPDHP